MSGTIVKAYRNAGTVRVTFPKKLWEALGRPKKFELTLEGDKIVLRPLKE